MDDKVMVYRGADQPDMSVINPESDVWQHIKVGRIGFLTTRCIFRIYIIDSPILYRCKLADSLRLYQCGWTPYRCCWQARIDSL